MLQGCVEAFRFGELASKEMNRFWCGGFGGDGEVETLCVRMCEPDEGGNGRENPRAGRDGRGSYFIMS